jgi:signal transduction histidine kinase
MHTHTHRTYPSEGTALNNVSAHAFGAKRVPRHDRPSMPTSIRHRLLLLMLAVILPGLAGVLWMIGRTNLYERAVIERNLSDTTRALAMVVDRELSQRAAIARVLSSSRTLETAPEVSEHQLATFERQARRAMDGLNGWVELRSAQGELLTTAPAADPSPRSGTAVAPKFYEQPVVLPLNRHGGAEHASVVQPIQRDGRAVLNLAVTIVPAELQRILDQQRLPTDWVATVVDSRGTVLARHPGGAAFVGRLAHADLVRRLKDQSEMQFESTAPDGATLLNSYSTSSQGWTFITTLPVVRYGPLASEAVLRVAGAALALLAIAVLASLWVARGIAGPVSALTAAARRLQRGEPVSHRPSGITECDEVGAALADAAQTLGQGRAELERQVAEAVQRTRDTERRASEGQHAQALGRLTGGVAHDFNNLLGVISNNVHLVRRTAPDSRAEAATGAILRAVEAGSRLTRHLLRLTGRQVVQPRTIDLRTQLPASLDLLTTVLGHRIQVSLAVAPDTACISIDPSEFELALVNLALNCREAIPALGNVWLEARNADASDVHALPPGPYVLITVRNDGRGRGDTQGGHALEVSADAKSTGTELALSQVHGFCVQAGGTTQLTSTPGSPATVTMVLPADPAPAGEQTPPNEQIKGRRVLLVEDNVELGDVTAALLDTYGCIVERAEGPNAALRFLDGDPAVDVMLTDVLMPGGMDGLALAREARRRHPGLPIVLISGYNTDGNAGREFPILRKPATPDQLVAALQLAIEAAAGKK